MSLKILGGFYKNHPLKSPSSKLTKPTTSLVRKAVFDICQTKIQEAYFLDLFACSGAMGLEALSRGAKHATFIEKERKTGSILKENIALLKMESLSSLLIGDVSSIVPKLIAQAKLYDIIYIDPPYPLFHEKSKPIEKLILSIDSSSLLSNEGFLFIEEGSPSSIAFLFSSLSSLQQQSTRKFGDTLLHVLRKKN